MYHILGWFIVYIFLKPLILSTFSNILVWYHTKYSNAFYSLIVLSFSFLILLFIFSFSFSDFLAFSYFMVLSNNRLWFYQEKPTIFLKPHFSYYSYSFLSTFLVFFLCIFLFLLNSIWMLWIFLLTGWKHLSM